MACSEPERAKCARFQKWRNLWATVEKVISLKSRLQLPQQPTPLYEQVQYARGAGASAATQSRPQELTVSDDHNDASGGGIEQAA